ncbi:MAG: DUF6020 family protein [Roseburia sp.]|nr:DUF6020 family protein [Roseburia sp.]MCM1097285.1 DUF6020 family protein [Ruminococcus flavefaciens]
MDRKKIVDKKKIIAESAALAFLKCLVTLWALSGDSLSLMLSGYSLDAPVAKYLFTLLESLDGWGVEKLFMALGLGLVYYLVRDRQKSPWVSGISAFFAVCTVIGISYSKTNSWSCLFLFKLQFLLACFVAAGYYFAYKNSILFIAWIFDHKKHWLRKEPVNAVEKFLFLEHPFSGPLLFLLVLALPWLVFYFPGTLQWDAHAQLWVFWGDPTAAARAGEHPVILTQIMGGCIWLGRTLFHSDSIGLFFYTGAQFMIQSLTFAYACFLLHTPKLSSPILFRWGALIYWAVHPLFPIWGYTMVKDSPFYIFILLNIVVLADMISSRNARATWWQICLLFVSIAGTSLSRNDGRYVMLAVLLSALVLYRKYWRISLAGIAFCLFLAFMVDDIYMPSRHISRGNTGDVLSVPLQQTARYLREHYDELTPEETAVLQKGFTVGLDEIAGGYNPICSDPVKAYFQIPDSAYLKSYFKVWLQQLRKHPDTYVQAFLNHIYGYFYPDRHDYQYDTLHLTGVFFIGNSDKWHDDYLDMEFAVSDDSGRRILQHFFYTVEKMPVFGMLFSAGFHTYILLGECTYLFAKKRRRELLPLVPGLFVLLLRLFSPVNASVRYTLPIMAALPVTAAWCYSAAHREKQIEDKINTKQIPKEKVTGKRAGARKGVQE